METNNPWTIIDHQIVYTNNWIEVIHHNVLNGSGKNGIYGKVHFKNIAIGIVPIDDDDNTWLVGQYRFPLNLYSWEIPEGGCPLNHQPIEAAKRELLEETGLVANEWTEILKMHLSNSVSDELAIVFVAKKLTQHQPQPEDTEQLTIKKIPLTTVFKMVEKGEITDAVSVAALQNLELKLLKGEL
ncbi:MAG: NUDIX domain-containing protein [Chitinophagaceae bacterium]